MDCSISRPGGLTATRPAFFLDASDELATGKDLQADRPAGVAILRPAKPRNLAGSSR